MEPEVRFVGVKIPGKSTVVVDESLEPGAFYSTLHITQFALAENVKPGRNTISLKTPIGETFVLGTLRKDHCEQFQADYMLSGEVEVSNSGDSEVHLTGYQTITNMLETGIDQDSPSLSEDDQDFEEEYNEKQLAQALRQRLAQAASSSEEQEEEGEGDDDDDGDDRLAALTALIRQDAEQGAENSKKSRSKKGGEAIDTDTLLAALKEAEAAQHGSDSSDEDDAEEEEEDSEEEEAPQLEPAFAPSKTSKKRAGPAEVGLANKKVKTSNDKPGSADVQWAAQIRQHIAKHGPMKLGAIGTAVKKPAGVTKKLKQIISEDNSLSIGDGEVVTVV